MDATPPIQLAVRQVADRALVAVTGDLDLATSPTFRSCLAGLIDSGTATIIVDLGGVAFLDSTALSVLISAHNRMASRQGRFAVVCLHPQVRTVFELTGLDRVITVHDHLDAAYGAAFE